MSKSPSPHNSHQPSLSASGYQTSVVRCAIALGLIVLGIAWVATYLNFGKTPASAAAGSKADIAFMAQLDMWNFAIGFGLIFLGLIVSAHPSTPLGRGRGVVVGMLGCFLIGLLWIVIFYFTAQESYELPLMKDLQNWNLIVAVGFMAVGFAFATKWE